MRKFILLLCVCVVQSSRICLSDMYTANLYGFPLTQSFYMNSYQQYDTDTPRYLNLLEGLCLCSNKRMKNGIPSGDEPNGVCEDVGNSTHPSVYDFGTDCDDCGPRGNYPVLDCVECDTFSNSITLTTLQLSAKKSGVFCETPRGNVFTESEYSLKYFNHQLIDLGDGTEFCELSYFENGVKIPYKIQPHSNFTLYYENDQTSTASNITNENYHVFLQIREDVAHFTIHPLNEESPITGFVTKTPSVLDFYPFNTFDFQYFDHFILGMVKDANSNHVYHAYIPYSMVACESSTDNLYQVYSNCTLHSEYSQAFKYEHNKTLGDYPIEIVQSFPKLDEAVTKRKLSTVEDGMIQTHITCEDNRCLLEFFAHKYDSALLQMYGFRLKTNDAQFVDSTYCRDIVYSYDDRELHRKHDMGSENKCVWISDNRISLMNITDSTLNVAYAKLPTAIAMLGEFNSQFHLFSIEMEMSVNATFEFSDTTLLYLSRNNNPRSPVCEAVYDMFNDIYIEMCRTTLMKSVVLESNLSLPSPLNITRQNLPPQLPPIPPAPPPPPVSPAPPNIEFESQTFTISTSSHMNFSIYCKKDAVQVLQITNHSISATDKFIQNENLPLGSECTVSLQSTSGSGIFQSNFHSDLNCVLSRTEEFKVCHFQVGVTRSSRFMPSPPPPPRKAMREWVYASLEFCNSLLNANEIDYFITRNNESKLHMNDFPSDQSGLSFFSGCKMFTDHYVLLDEGRPVECNPYTFVSGYQYSPLINYTSLLSQSSLQFTAFLPDATLQFPGDDTTLIDHQAFIMSVSSDTVSETVCHFRPYFPPPPSNPPSPPVPPSPPASPPPPSAPPNVHVYLDTCTINFAQTKCILTNVASFHQLHIALNCDNTRCVTHSTEFDSAITVMTNKNDAFVSIVGQTFALTSNTGNGYVAIASTCTCTIDTTNSGNLLAVTPDLSTYYTSSELIYTAP